MLTQKMIRVISLLKQVSNSCPAIADEDAVWLESLCRAGLVHRTDEDTDTLSHYALTKPLRQISLCDVLRVAGGEVVLSFDDQKEIYDRYGAAGQRLGVTNYMACRFLSEINLAEVVLPDADSEDKKESK
jgi:hypothetical protein